MKETIIGALLTIAFGFAGDAIAQNEECRSNGPEIRTVSVRIGQEKTMARGKLRIRFLEMIEDSRCPLDVNCIQAGNAQIKIRVSGSGRPRELVLNTNAPNKAAVYGGYELSLYTLTPEPRTNIRINRTGYVAAVRYCRA